MNRTRLRLIVSGRVQGVGFRAFLGREGARLGLSGWARNLADGRVEAEFAGPAAAVEAMRAACARGPAHARVDSVESVETGAGGLPFAFEICADG